MADEPQKSTVDILFGDPTVVMRPAFINRERDALSQLDITKQQYDQEGTDHVALLQESGLSAYDVGPMLWDRRIDAAIRRAQSTPERTPTELHAQEVRVREAVRGTYHDADELVARARRFVQSQPKLHALLEDTGAGSDPAVVLKIVEHVRRIGFK